MDAIHLASRGPYTLCQLRLALALGTCSPPPCQLATCGNLCSQAIRGHPSSRWGRLLHLDSSGAWAPEAVRPRVSRWHTAWPRPGFTPRAPRHTTAEPRLLWEPELLLVPAPPILVHRSVLFLVLCRLLTDILCVIAMFGLSTNLARSQSSIFYFSNIRNTVKQIYTYALEKGNILPG